MPVNSSTPPSSLPSNGLDAELDEQLNKWTAECVILAEGASSGGKAYAYSVPLLIASQRGRTMEVAQLASQMCRHLEEEASSRQISPAFHAWMLGRLLLASDDIGDTVGATAFQTQLSALLDKLTDEREKVEGGRGVAGGDVMEVVLSIACDPHNTLILFNS